MAIFSKSCKSCKIADIAITNMTVPSYIYLHDFKGGNALVTNSSGVAGVNESQWIQIIKKMNLQTN